MITDEQKKLVLDTYFPEVTVKRFILKNYKKRKGCFLRSSVDENIMTEGMTYYYNDKNDDFYYKRWHYTIPTSFVKEYINWYTIIEKVRKHIQITDQAIDLMAQKDKENVWFFQNLKQESEKEWTVITTPK